MNRRVGSVMLSDEKDTTTRESRRTLFWRIRRRGIAKMGGM